MAEIMRAYIAIPTYNGGKVWEKCAKSIKKYSPQDTFVQIIDSGSKDNTVEIAKKYGFHVKIINPQEFNHGGTRNYLVNIHKDEFDVVVFLTQDAIPEPDFYKNIVSVFADNTVSCAYGRQLPHDDANPISYHARKFNYRAESYIANIDSVGSMGLKAAFISNSFSAYRLNTFIELGGFPKNTILSEDMYFAAKSLLAGYKVVYSAEAKVRHSHNYSAIDEFKRYFDIGVFHADESWIRQKFGGAGGEGKKFIFSELKFLLKKAPFTIPRSAMHNFLKILGYKLGQNYKLLPPSVVKKLSMHKNFWS